ncbi:PH domain-containing protein [Belnapia sp. T6]|uniref:PH domain-containing protein n=1 Tax=Belnapia mucosa TaxID=2804532 RepID=A0ABS1V3G5_9PROT|nr:PH domain-containing protein [Belnapia mucosa]MBL6456215.1 PH domain-containing protein [Belnapia mucosa]
MAETILLTTHETKRSYGLWRGALALLLLGLPFLGRQRITITDERLIIEAGFLTKRRDDIEVFRIRDVVSTQSLWQRLLGIGDIVVKAVEGRGPEEVQLLKGVPDPVGVSEAIRRAWNQSRPRGPATAVD